MIQRLLALRHKPFVKDTLILQGASVVQSGTYLATSLLIARLLGPYELGRWTTAREIYTIVFLLLNMGLGTAAVSQYSAAVGAGDSQAARNVLAALLKLGVMMAGAIVILGHYAAPWAAEEYYGDRTVGAYTAILCWASIGEVLRALTMAVLNGTRQMKPYALFDMTANLLRVGLVVAALLTGQGAMAVAWAFLAHGLLTGILALVAYKKARGGDPKLAPPPLREVLVAVPTAPLRAFFGISYIMALNKAMNAIVTKLGVLFIPALGMVFAEAAAFADGGVFSIASVLTLVLTGLVGAIAQAVLPALGLKLGGADVPLEKMGPMIKRLVLTSAGLTAVATVVTVPLFWVVVNYGYGAGYEEAFPYYLWLAVGQIFIGFCVANDAFFIYAGRLKSYFCWNLLYLAIGIAAIYSAGVRWGPMGVAAATGLCRVLILGHLVYIWIYFRRVKRTAKAGLDAPEAERHPPLPERDR